MTKLAMALAGLMIFLAAGCANTQQTSSDTLDGNAFRQAFNDENAYTDVWYCGSDSTYTYYCFEHWNIRQDGSDGSCDVRKFFKVANSDNITPYDTFPHTTDEDKWRLMRPEKPSQKVISPQSNFGTPVVP